MKKLLAMDMSSFIWNSLLGGKDTENGYKQIHNDKEIWINSCWYGYERVLNRMIDLLKKYKLQPINCVLVFEGQSSKSQRQLINAKYKSGEEKAPGMYVEFEKVRDMLKETWKGLGAQTMWQDFAEGDDVLAWLAENTETDLIVATFDNDLTTLNFTNAYGAKVSTWIDQMEAYNKYGVFDYHLVTTYKALVGDSSDKIVGCPGFGPGKWDDLVNGIGYDGIQEIHGMLLQSNLNPLFDCLEGYNKKTTKALQLIVDNAPVVINSFDLAKLRPRWVNTMRNPIHWEPGMVRELRDDDDPRLKHWYGKSILVTADNFDEACAWALPLIKASMEVALDIETTTPDESDDWLEALGDPDGVDVFGSTLCGMGLTFGKNNQFSLYFSVDHAETANIESEALRQFIAQIPQSIPLVIQNVSFELAVLFNEWADRQMDNGYEGFLPNVLDTAIEGSYVDENSPRGLKERSHSILGYRQQTFLETVVLTGAPGELPPGGKHQRYSYETRTVGTGKFEPLTEEEIAAGFTPIELTKTEPLLQATGEFDEEGVEIMEPVVATETRRYKMHELTAEHVFGYGVDDTICTIALHNYYRLHMQLEHHWKVYLDVEIDAAYQHAQNFIRGAKCSVEKVNELAAEDTITYDKAWAVVREFLITRGWAGTSPPTYTVDITAAQIKEAYSIVTGKELDTQMRTPSKLVTFIREMEDEPQFAGMLEMLLAAKDTAPEHEMPAGREFTAYVRKFFKGEPQFNKGSPVQMSRLMYETMGLPVRVYNKATPVMKKAGIFRGSPSTGALAIAYALQECDFELKPVLESLKLMGMVTTRRSLYYSKYPYFCHWKDGKIRSSHNQAATNTRRATESKPNKQQLPKHAKIEGQEAKFREAIVPHHPDAVIVSFDFDSQEMVLIAEQSQDPNMLSCFVGEQRRSPHTITGLGIVRAEQGFDWTYDEFVAYMEGTDKVMKDIAKEARKLGKKVNFTAEYLAMAPKVAETLMISEEKAQLFLDAREAMYPVAGQWKQAIIAEVKEYGIVRTMLGAVRHLGQKLMHGLSYEKSKAERQAVNFKVQGPAAEQTKLAEGRCWKTRLFSDFDAVCYGPIHDELVSSVLIKDLPEFLPRMHACMTAKYADMKIEVVSTISFGLDFYRQVEIGDKPTPEAIEAGLAQMWKERAERDALRKAA